MYVCVYILFTYLCYISEFFFSGLRICNKIIHHFPSQTEGQSSLWTNSDKQHPHLVKVAWAGDLISEESPVLSQTALPVQPVVLNEMNLLVSAQCFREGGWEESPNSLCAMIGSSELHKLSLDYSILFP